ncbi:MAG: DEAD/DEAH box helicase [Sporichthyaceae bacterium]|nr:DEAD/DEAH box helicase [Sporichthyaceae bacterium]
MLSPAVLSPTSDPALAGGFAAVGVPNELIATLAGHGITDPFPIQAATLPDSLAGRDVLGRGRTGSGKTIAFALPIVAALSRSGRRRAPKRPRALVLVPTRELASQVARTLEPLVAAAGQRVTTVFGAVAQGRQVGALRSGVDVLVACPGRLEDLLRQGHVSLDAVEVSVLDEADHMADLGFLPAVRRILDLTPRGTQRLLFSATLDGGVDVLVRRYLVNPVTHSVDPVNAPVSTMRHYVFAVSAADKAQVIRELAAGRSRSLLFTRTKHAAKKLARQLNQAGIAAVDLHGNLSQNARDRNLAAFADGTARVLVATDIAARGIHIDEIGLVVHVDPPVEHKAYLHRSGRTARAGASGTVVTLATPDQAGDVRALARKAGIMPQTATIAPGARQIVELTGPPAPYVAPTVPSRPERSAARSTSDRGTPARYQRQPGTRSTGVVAHSRRGLSRRSGSRSRRAA